MSALARAADRLATGSTMIVRRLGDRTAAWVRRGRRDDLSGWRATLGCWLRLIAIALGGYLLYRLVRAAPLLLWFFSASWALTSWRVGRPASKAPEAPATDASAEAVRRLLLDLMGDASAVHLRTVLAHLHKHGQWEGRTMADLRAHLEALHIPVHPKVKAPGGGPTRGVRKADLAPSPGSAPQASTEPSTAA